MAETAFSNDSTIISGPSFHVDLPTIDALHPVHYSRRLYFFQCQSSSQRDSQLTALKTGLQALILRCPILGGIVAPLPQDVADKLPPDWRTILPGPGLELVVRDLRSKMDSLEELEKADFPPSKLPYDLLVPIPQDISNEKPFAACRVQFSAINGGTVITFSMSHSVGDGVGNDELIRILSDETRLAQTQSTEADSLRSKAVATTFGVDRGAMRNITSETVFNIEDHPGYMWDTTDKYGSKPSQKHPYQATSPEVPTLFSISPEKLAILKADATQPNSPAISTHDAIAALIWRSILFIRSRRSPEAQEIAHSTTADLFLPSDARRHLTLPTSYIGNVVYQLRATLDLDTLFSSTGLQYAASALRRSISAVNPSLVSSLMKMTNKQWIPWSFVGTWSTTGVAMGTDWTSTGLYKNDWGKAFGPVVRYRYPGENYLNAVMPKLPNGGAEMIVSVLPEEVEILKGPECFGKYI